MKSNKENVQNQFYKNSKVHVTQGTQLWNAEKKNRTKKEKTKQTNKQTNKLTSKKPTKEHKNKNKTNKQTYETTHIKITIKN